MANANASAASKVDVLMVGTGEYTTGFGLNSAKTDKGAGVVALTMFDLRKRGLVGEMHLAGTNGRKLPDIRSHMGRAIGEAYHASGYDLSCATYPGDDAVDPSAYSAALKVLPKGSAVTIFTPDDTHFAIALECVKAGMHVMVTKPICKTLAEHRELAAAAEAANVLVAIEVHKRWDPIYVDARDRMRAMGAPVSYFTSYMSQPKIQLQTFRAWAGLSSDISYYLNSHHIDFHEWVADGASRPEKVFAMGSTGVACKELGRPCEDTITVNAVWANNDGSQAIASYTSSWIAPPSDVHSQQRFFAMTQKGEVTVDQAHRGYSMATDDKGYASSNPLFMKYTPLDGKFTGQTGYGYRSLEAFIAAVAEIRSGAKAPRDFDASLPTVHTTYLTTAVLEAGRRSLDGGNSVQEIVYEGPDSHVPIDIRTAGSSSPAATA